MRNISIDMESVLIDRIMEVEGENGLCKVVKVIRIGIHDRLVLLKTKDDIKLFKIGIYYPSIKEIVDTDEEDWDI